MLNVIGFGKQGHKCSYRLDYVYPPFSNSKLVIQTLKLDSDFQYRNIEAYQIECARWMHVIMIDIMNHDMSEVQSGL